MIKNIFYINEADKEKNLNLNNSNSFDSKKIGLVLSNNPQVLIKHWIKFQQEWVCNIYKEFQDYDKYIILMFLMSKTWQDNAELFKFNSIDEHYSQSRINLPDVSLSEISKSLKTPKETTRRKLVELEKKNIIKREGQKIILGQLALSLQKPETSIKTLSIFFEKLSILLSAEDWFGPAISREDIELYFNKYYTVFWNRFFKMQIPFLVRWKTIFGDLESWVIWANMGINQSSNLEKISTNSKKKFSLSEVKSGKIYIDNQDIHEVSLRSLRKSLSMVSQDIVLFDDTVKANIAYANSKASDEEIVEACNFAAANEFIKKLPEGYDTIIGENGVKLSGGQKQRLSIARAILKKSPIILLDEATSSLDADSEEVVQNAISNLIKNKTTLVIAHRLSTIHNADQIFVLKNGTIIDSGSHDYLIEKSNEYKSVTCINAKPKRIISCTSNFIPLIIKVAPEQTQVQSITQVFNLSKAMVNKKVKPTDSSKFHESLIDDISSMGLTNNTGCGKIKKTQKLKSGLNGGQNRILFFVHVNMNVSRIILILVAN